MAVRRRRAAGADQVLTLAEVGGVAAWLDLLVGVPIEAPHLGGRRWPSYGALVGAWQAVDGPARVCGPCRGDGRRAPFAWVLARWARRWPAGDVEAAGAALWVRRYGTVADDGHREDS